MCAHWRRETSDLFIHRQTKQNHAEQMSLHPICSKLLQREHRRPGNSNTTCLGGVMLTWRRRTADSLDGEFLRVISFLLPLSLRTLILLDPHQP